MDFSRFTKIDPAQRFDVMKKFAPLLHFHSQEKYLPSSADWFLSRTKLRLDIKGGGDKGFKDWDGSAGKLLGMVENGHHSSGNYPSRYFLQIKQKSMRRGDLAGAKCYGAVRRAPGSETQWDILYIFFYPYNGKLGISGEHEGDWEHITVRVDNDFAAVEKVYFSAHYHEGQWFFPRSANNPRGVELTALPGENDANHPVVFVAKHSHASYPEEGKHPRGTIMLSTGGIKDILWDQLPDDDCGNSANDHLIWKCAEHMADILVDGKDWMNYSGMWGAKGAFDGPHGPAFQGWWYDDDCCRMHYDAVIRFLERNNPCSSVAYETTDDAGQIITASYRRGYNPDKVRALVMRNVRSGAVISLYRNDKGSEKDDWMKVTVKTKTDYYYINSLEPATKKDPRIYEDDFVKIEYGFKSFLDGKVKYVKIE